MRTRIFLAAVGLCSIAVRVFAADVSGDWEFAGTSLGDTKYARVTFHTDGEKLTGRLSEITLEGRVKEDEITFTGKRGGGKFGDFFGKIADDKIEGTAHYDGQEVKWKARRFAIPPSSPQTHDFEPKEFHRVFSDSIAPVLHIFPGDTVNTWSVDAGGVDRNGVKLSQGGNPQTGPFYVEGAMPGDLLEVKLTKIRLNRDYAVSGDRIMAPALNPWNLPKFEDHADGTWLLDREKMLGRLKHPTPHLTNYTVRLQPFLGCIAVAPPGHQSFRTGYLGSYGGNLDCNLLREGTTVYLPVFAPGALLFVGDGHAAQGDGELTGDALETSMDIQFTVKLHQGKSTGNPYFENDEYLMASGIAGSLNDALQGATSSLFDIIKRDYKLGDKEAALVFGTALQYNIAEVVDPLVHVVAKVRKEALAKLK
jgi:acetamidase/formamidase